MKIIVKTDGFLTTKQIEELPRIKQQILNEDYAIVPSWITVAIISDSGEVTKI